MNDELYIVFAENVGEDNEGKYFYRLLFSKDPDIVWGNNFNITPAGIVPDLEPDSATISKEYFLTTNIKLGTAVESTWFSLQDCIDGIISLAFTTEGDKIVNIPFGMEFEKVEEYVSWTGWEMKEVKYKPKKVETDEEES